jgi:hypothetical protein
MRPERETLDFGPQRMLSLVEDLVGDAEIEGTLLGSIEQFG